MYHRVLLRFLAQGLERTLAHLLPALLPEKADPALDSLPMLD